MAPNSLRSGTKQGKKMANENKKVLFSFGSPDIFFVVQNKYQKCNETNRDILEKRFTISSLIFYTFLN